MNEGKTTLDRVIYRTVQERKLFAFRYCVATRRSGAAPGLMTASTPSLTAADCARHCRDVVFGDALADDDPQRTGFGIELEWLTAGPHLERLDAATAASPIEALSPFVSGSRLTLEPGGQIELSSAPTATLSEACRLTANELFELDRWCERHQIGLFALGADPVRAPERVLEHARYTAMEQYFDQMGPAGRTMMHNTASVQINLGLGAPDERNSRWQTLNRIAPVLAAAFANSPLMGGTPSGWLSSRLRNWWALDPTRSRPVPLGPDPVEAYISYALDARVAFLAPADGTCRLVGRALTFRQWIVEGNDGTWPTPHDFAYHLTTLFPPVRPKGWFELRAIDALPTPFWMVAAAVAGSLTIDQEARAEAAVLLDRSGADRLWADAAKHALHHPVLGPAAINLFAIARRALHRLDVDPSIVDVVETYTDRWVGRGRCPADDRLDAWRATGELFPSRESPVPYGRHAWTSPS